MIRIWIRRMLVGFTGALVMGSLAGIAVVQAQTANPQIPGQECTGCHQILQTHWQDSAHGQAGVDPVFTAAWDEHGNPAECMACHATGYHTDTQTWDVEGVYCTVCHTPSPDNHPEEIMPTDVSSRMCGECHLDTFAEWETSVHAQEDLTCNRCHNTHTTTIKAEDVQHLCQACHNEEVHFFAYTPHAQQGLLCTDCHLQVSEAEMGEGHGSRLHTFAVDLDTCTECHAEGMHFPLPTGVNETGTPLGAGINLPVDAGLSATPQPVSPVGFSLLAGLVGMAFGILLAPWLERWFRALGQLDQ